MEPWELWEPWVSWEPWEPWEPWKPLGEAVAWQGKGWVSPGHLSFCFIKETLVDAEMHKIPTTITTTSSHALKCGAIRWLILNMVDGTSNIR